ncbi:MAG TPA: S8/S53 family peptidase, partial [Streptosporangiaceae bacterium]
GRPRPASGPEPHRHAKPHLDAFGMTAHGVDARLQGRVLRLTHDSMESQELADLARALRAQHFSASLAITPMAAGVVKGIGGPNPAPSPGRFEADGGPGSPSNVAILDTGRAGQQRTDGWLEGVAGDKDPLDAFPPPHGDGYLDADAGHGTFVTGIVQQIAPGARIKHYKAVDSDGIATETAIASEMIRAVIEEGAQIVNLSLGCHTHDDVPPIAIAAALEIIEEWKQKEHAEVVIVAAAGNYGDKTPCWPAAFPEVVSVAGLTRGLRPAPWSSRGFWVKCSTVAQGVRSTYVEGQESPWLDPSPEYFGANSWAAWSGTSFAAAQVTGALARLCEEMSYSPYEALHRLLRASRPIPQFGRALKILPTI